MRVTLSEELELKAPPSKAWTLFNSREYSKMFIEEKLMDASEYVEGDGGIGTIEKVTMKGGSEFAYYKYTQIDNMNKVREIELVEGGLLNFGFNYYRAKEEIKENPNDKTGLTYLLKLTRDYELKEEFATNTSLVTDFSLATLASIVNKHLLRSD